jgi:hypothetical protein
MKDLQWFLAVVALAVVVFVVVFAGQFLSVNTAPPTNSHGNAVSNPEQNLEITFVSKSAPPTGTPYEIEHHGHGEAQFFFVNENESKVSVGLERSSCKCTEAELLLISGPAANWFSGLGVAYVGLSPPVGSLGVVTAHPLALEGLRAQAEVHELKRDKETVPVSPGQGGWVRLAWSGDRPGPMTQYATLFMNNPLGGSTATLDIRSYVHPPIRFRSVEPLGVLREASLADGLKREVLIWSSTRPELVVKVRAESSRSDAKTDPIEVGAPIPLSSAERRELEKRNNMAGEAAAPGLVVSAYRVPITLRSVAADGKTPFPIGPFRRKLVVTSPEFPANEPGIITLTGQVRGVVEIGNEDHQGVVTFGSFPSKRGKTEAISLSSDVSGIQLSVDTSRSSPFLSASLGEAQKVGMTRQLWKLKLEVKPGAAQGAFPRRDDPIYEDSAVYLLATVPGQPPRPVRIAVQGTASGG